MNIEIELKIEVPKSQLEKLNIWLGENAQYVYENFEVVIDDVKDLGVFIEFEIKNHTGTPQEGLGEIKKFIKSLGFDKIMIQKRGYVSMLWNPDVEFGVEEIL